MSRFTCTVIVALASMAMTANAFVPQSSFRLSPSSMHYLKTSSMLSSSPRTSRKSGVNTFGMQYSNDDVPALDRFVACLPYALPLADSFEWGHFLFDKFPILALPFVPLFPVISLLNAPFVSFAVFIALFAFVTRNPSIPRFVRYNTLQVIGEHRCHLV